MKNEFKVGICQITSVDDVDLNYKVIEDLVRKVPKSEKVDLFCFPENSLYMRVLEGEKIDGLDLNHPVLGQLIKLAQEYETNLHLGASPLRIDGHLYNASIFIRADGALSSTYQKLHLFDIQLQGQAPVRESDIFKRGAEPGIIEIAGWKIGQSICYDLRFAELYAHYARHECDLILVPSAFLPKTGEAHWEILIRARAIESQAYVAASAQGGHHVGTRGGARQTHGHSLLVDPWGKIVSEIKSQPSVEVHVLRKDRIQEVRRQIPMKSHRRFMVSI